MDINNVQYEWRFNQLEILPIESGHTDMVTNVHWELYATTGSYTANKTGVIDIVYNPDAEWYEFAVLTKDEVQHWVEDRMNYYNPDAVLQLKEKLANEIELQIVPPSIIVKSPWL
jgi:hypothetical protein